LGATRFLPSRIDEPPKNGDQPSVYVTARLALSPSGAAELVNALTNMMTVMTQVTSQQKQQPVGVMPRAN
jgi:hypothetical protein